MCRQYELDLNKELDITCPIRIIHGLQDTEIDPAESLKVPVPYLYFKMDGLMRSSRRT
jgi:pimeloyl-ACP methyl ester carboxylesterase